MPRKTEYKFTEYLDKEKENILFVKFVLSKDSEGPEEFVVSQIATIKGQMQEIIRFDCSAKERMNVHRFYTMPPEKQYLDMGINYETLELAKAGIRQNWHVYRMKYFETYNR